MWHPEGWARLGGGITLYFLRNFSLKKGFLVGKRPA
jgi:hypothetical protein